MEHNLRSTLFLEHPVDTKTKRFGELFDNEIIEIMKLIY